MQISIGCSHFSTSVVLQEHICSIHKLLRVNINTKNWSGEPLMPLNTPPLWFDASKELSCSPQVLARLLLYPLPWLKQQMESPGSLSLLQLLLPVQPKGVWQCSLSCLGELRVRRAPHEHVVQLWEGASMWMVMQLSWGGGEPPCGMWLEGQWLALIRPFWYSSGLCGPGLLGIGHPYTKVLIFDQGPKAKIQSISNSLAFKKQWKYKNTMISQP